MIPVYDVSAAQCFTPHILKCPIVPQTSQISSRPFAGTLLSRPKRTREDRRTETTITR